MQGGAIAIGPEPAKAAAVAILVHGRGRSAREMADLAIAFALPTIRFVVPAAPGATSYPESFFAPIDRNERSLSRSIATYRTIVDELIAGGVPPENLILGGFPQGTCLAAEFVIHHPAQTALLSFGVWYLIALGLLAIVVMLVAPRGLWGLFAQRFDLQIFPVRRPLRLSGDKDV
jgi:predicted esterase